MKTFIYLLLFIPSLLLAQVDSKQIQGAWVLSYIDAKGTIQVLKDGNATTTISKTEKPETIEVPLLTYIQKDMKIGLTSFVFHEQSYEFYRGRQVTFAGNYKINGQKLKLTFGTDKEPGEKVNKIITLSANQLVIESESHQKPITLFFNKK